MDAFIVVKNCHHHYNNLQRKLLDILMSNEGVLKLSDIDFQRSPDGKLRRSTNRNHKSQFGNMVLTELSI